MTSAILCYVSMIQSEFEDLYVKLFPGLYHYQSEVILLKQ